MLGFVRSTCPFVRGECYARRVGLDTDVVLQAFSKAFLKCYRNLVQAEEHFRHCGIFLEHPEGTGYFFGSSSDTSRPRFSPSSGDGHTAAKCEVMKQSEDAAFHYVFTWIEGNRQKGWTTHYRPIHPPLSAEMERTFSFLGLRTFDQCPEFDFERCHWRFTPYEQQGRSAFEGNNDTAYRWYYAHAEHFSPGLEKLLQAQEVILPFRMNVIPLPSVTPSEPAFTVRETTPRQRRPSSRASYKYNYDVAISFAGTERVLAQTLASQVTDAGFTPFYDEFYPEQLWGKDLVALFDNIYRKWSRYCVMLISREYADRLWPTQERRSALARQLQERGQDYILPIQVEDVDLEGLPPTIGYLSLKQYTVEQIASILIKKLQSLE
jgi:hypothetical protein